ncbi:hypothetical protein [Duganella sp. OV458]|uniref:hypothetical protein n=1 Tax=Duganella sp. OV458 TaxID=1855290 RepID=UPI00158714AC|nr:hypothetical protein [Duganella sp. OV458]
MYAPISVKPARKFSRARQFTLLPEQWKFQRKMFGGAWRWLHHLHFDTSAPAAVSINRT